MICPSIVLKVERSQAVQWTALCDFDRVQAAGFCATVELWGMQFQTVSGTDINSTWPRIQSWPSLWCAMTQHLSCQGPAHCIRDYYCKESLENQHQTMDHKTLKTFSPPSFYTFKLVLFANSWLTDTHTSVLIGACPAVHFLVLLNPLLQKDWQQGGDVWSTCFLKLKQREGERQ